ncbi:MAG: putative undecaprenyl-phosphate glycosyl-phosphate transferase [Frankiales bacterium]|nr:putative undecaprenyl-phosphate glycosyl-phosphate transferase [Frankiales bacterium]
MSTTHGLVYAPPLASARPSWLSRYVQVLVVLDVLCAALVGLAVVQLRFLGEAVALGGIDYRVLAVLSAPAWAAALALSGAYERRVVGLGTDEFRRVLGSGVRGLAGLAVLLVATKADVARSVLAVDLPAVVALTLIGRWAARNALHKLRRRGRCVHRVLVVGSSAECARLLNNLSRHAEAGMQVVGCCTEGVGDALGVPVLGPVEEAGLRAIATGVDTVAVAGTSSLGEDGLRRLAWAVERRGVDLLVAPGLTYVAVPRIVMRPVDGTPLLHVHEPTLEGPKKLLKDAFDRVIALLALALCTPLVAVLALGVVITSRGPAFFRQERTGRDGRTFRIWKLRTMVDGAAAVAVTGNDADGLLFKLRRDPRITPFGRFLRRWSLDELPQLLNVLTGSMSLVGPRPPLPTEVARYGEDVRRRLLVRPGLTGLWQVSGRSDLPWDEAVRLDLQYVENWSLALDLVILLRTLAAVLRRRGAY